MRWLKTIGVVFVCVLAAAIAVFSSAPSRELTVLVESAGEHLYGMDIKEPPSVESKRREKVSDVLALKDALKYLDVDFFNESKVREIAEGAKEFNIPGFRENRKLVASVDGGLHNPSVLVFDSSWGIRDGSHDVPKFIYPHLSGIKRPEKEDDIAFMTILELGALIKTKQITSSELTAIFLRRLKRYDHVLETVITYTEELAYSQAKMADELLEQGVYLGPLHGIPYGLKDIIAVPGYKTTWGSKAFKDQVIDTEAWVYKRLKEAGSVLIAKFVSGSLAYDDIWFGGRTRNPWNIEEYSTGSSAGSAASTSAGLVPFAIGSETCGSITYPAACCGITGLRPTFGTVGRSGVMALSGSLVVHVLSSMGVEVVPFKLNYTVKSVQQILNFTMDVDVLSHFDEWQRRGLDDEYEAQDQWPVELRRARLIPAVDYVQAQRARGKLIREVRESFTVDAFIGNATDWEKVCVGNLVGMPVVVVPAGFKSIEKPPKGGTNRRTSVTTGIYAAPDRDHIALALAMAYQSATNHHLKRPPIDDLWPNDPITVSGLS